MKYAVCDTAVPQERRQETNEKLLYLIDSGKAGEYGISGGDIYNLYTGDGGLHGLRRQDYENYASYSEAKKEIENGQFFTLRCFAVWLRKHCPRRRTRLWLT